MKGIHREVKVIHRDVKGIHRAVKRIHRVRIPGACRRPKFYSSF